jgi:hypothetical protein
MNIFQKAIDAYFVLLYAILECKNLSLALVLLVPLLTVTLDADSMIDKEHLMKYSYCGKMKTPVKIGGRVANSKTAEEDYRWVVFIKRKNLNINGRMDPTGCSGTVITDRLVDKIHNKSIVSPWIPHIK